jgi:hypothetical protein
MGRWRLVLAVVPMAWCVACHRTTDTACAKLLDDTTTSWARAQRAWSDDTTHPTWSNDSLRRVLVALGDTDQAMRNGIMSHLDDTARVNRLVHVDSMHQIQLRAIIARFGWPTRSMVGAKGETSAWLIVQHSDSAFENEGLRLMTAAPPGQVNPLEIAYLTDRTRVMRGRPQLYGTQFKAAGKGKWKLDSIEDSVHVDARRGAAGMEPLTVYTQCESGT